MNFDGYLDKCNETMSISNARVLTHFDMWSLKIPGNIENSVLPLLLDRKRQGEVHERIKRDRDLGLVSNEKTNVSP